MTSTIKMASMVGTAFLQRYYSRTIFAKKISIYDHFVTGISNNGYIQRYYLKPNVIKRLNRILKRQTSRKIGTQSQEPTAESNGSAMVVRLPHISLNQYEGENEKWWLFLMARENRECC